MELVEEKSERKGERAPEMHKIRVVGVGGAGGNAVNRMADMGFDGVTFIACNTDELALKNSKADITITLGPLLNRGLGAGNNPKVGEASAIESEAEIREVLAGAEIVFVSAGMGGGTGTGASPIIAKIAKELNALTVAVVTIPESTEGLLRLKSVADGVTKLYNCVDAMLIVNCDMMMNVIDPNWTMERVRAYVDGVLVRSVQAVSQIVSRYAEIQLDFADLRNAMTNSGISYIGIGSGTGPNRAKDALTQALNSPLLRNQDFRGARYVLVNMTFGAKHGVTLREHDFILKSLCQYTGYNVVLLNRDDSLKPNDSAIMWGEGKDLSIPDDSDEFNVTIVVTGYRKNLYDTRQKETNAGQIIIDENDNVSICDNIVENDEPAEELDFEEQLKALYLIEQEEDMSKKPKLAATFTYSDPVILSENAMLDEKELYNFETTPAFIRRKKSATN